MPRTRGREEACTHPSRGTTWRGFPSGPQVSRLDDEVWECMILMDSREDSWSLQIKNSWSDPQERESQWSAPCSTWR